MRVYIRKWDKAILHKLNVAYTKCYRILFSQHLKLCFKYEIEFTYAINIRDKNINNVFFKYKQI